ncbi:pyridoxal-phosphate dependent enzyme [Photobacterium sp. 53610]|uniref:pyridoxal-phosphate dependent enzyme n=1 Tax=Photobacterium sp. 53610 TaxID=3102789 RepID=UPI002ED8F4B9
MKVFSDPLAVRDIIGQLPTPIAELQFGSIELLAKLEYLQPTMSIKYRIARGLLIDLITSGTLTDSTEWVVEATAGNTAIALNRALRELRLSARVVAVVSDKVQRLKIARLQADGIVVRVVPYEVARPTPSTASPLIEALYATVHELPNAVIAGQFSSEANPRAHQLGTGREIVEQLGVPPDAIVCGAGTGGTITGIARAVKEAGWNSQIVLADPQGSVLGSAWRGESVAPGKSIIEGIGGDFVPEILDLNLVDDVVTVPDRESLTAVKRLKQAGFSVGLSSGCAVAASLRLAARDPIISRCLVLFADHGVWYE